MNTVRVDKRKSKQTHYKMSFAGIVSEIEDRIGKVRIDLIKVESDDDHIRLVCVADDYIRGNQMSIVLWFKHGEHINFSSDVLVGDIKDATNVSKINFFGTHSGNVFDYEYND